MSKCVKKYSFYVFYVKILTYKNKTKLKCKINLS